MIDSTDFTIPGTGALRNKLGITDPAALSRAATDSTVLRLSELHATPLRGGFDSTHLQAIQDAVQGFLHLGRGHIAGVDGAQFSGPIVEVLIDMVVDRLKVGGVKAAANGRSVKLGKSKSRRIRRRSRKNGWVRDAELVSEYAGAGDCEVGWVNHLRFSPLTGEAVAGDWRSAAMTRAR